MSTALGLHGAWEAGVWRRLCIDVGPDGLVLGGSVELHEDGKPGPVVISVRPVGWGDIRTPVEALTDLYLGEPDGEPKLWRDTPKFDIYGSEI